MESVEIARSSATALHAKAVAAGADATRLYEFAVGVAVDLGIDVESTSSGAAILNGARATFIPADRLIVHEATGTLFDLAFLVAHEVGHAVLGDAEGEEVQYSIDPFRAAEPSPTGFDRVVDYGRRQRRETQMDLFGRELLLPRATARRLHLEDGLGAVAIAERIGAPFEFVAQQLFDALLLPPFEPERKEERGHRLNPLQAAAAEDSGKAYVLEAGPGTGKTQTLSGRASYLLGRGVDPRRILVLTFSNKAAIEMGDRIAHHDTAAASAMWIGTFHAFGLDLIRRFYTELNLSKDPRLLDRTEAVELLEQEFARLPLKHYRDTYDPSRKIAEILAAISRAKDEVVNAAEYAALGRSMLEKARTEEEKIAAEKAMEVAVVYETYEAQKRRLHCVDFGDLVFLPVRLLEDYAQARQHLQEKYDHILVDEYQDVNRSSVRLLKALAQNATIWAVGDAKQAIYRFRGASSFNMERFDGEDFPGAGRGRLLENYRSVPEVLACISGFSNFMKGGGVNSGLTPSRRPSGVRPELQLVQSDDEQSVAISESIEEMRRAGYAYRDQAVVCTGNERLSTIAADLERLGIPVLFLGSLFERAEVKDLLALLSILIDGRAMGLLRIGTWPGFEMDLADVAAIIDHLRTIKNAGAGWVQRLGDTPILKPTTRSAVEKLAVLLDGFDQTSRPWTVLAYTLVERTRIAAGLAASGSISDRARGIAIWQLLNFLRVQPAARGLPIRRLLDRVRRLLRLSDERDLRQPPAAARGLDAVRLMTVHGAKGLEFPVIHFPGVNKGTIPRSAIPPRCPPPDGLIEGVEGSSTDAFRTAHALEQECLFYVAISRARDRLFFYAATRNSAGAARANSPFVDALAGSVSRRDVKPKRCLPPAAGETPVSVSLPGTPRYQAEQLALFERCPRRFFYTHLLQVGGARTSTPFTLTHDAVRAVVQELLAGRISLADPAAIELHLRKAFAAERLSEHGYAEDYFALAKGMLGYLVSSRSGFDVESPAPLVLQLGREEIAVVPDDVLKEPGGQRRFRKVRTGHLSATATKDLAAAAFVSAVQNTDTQALAEIVYLSDGKTHPLSLSPRELTSRREKLAAVIAAIRSGQFPAAPDAWTCPGCPSFFICGPVPSGALEKKL